MNDKNTYKIAVIPGDGIGPEIAGRGTCQLAVADEIQGHIHCLAAQVTGGDGAPV